LLLLMLFTASMTLRVLVIMGRVYFMCFLLLLEFPHGNVISYLPLRSLIDVAVDIKSEEVRDVDRHHVARETSRESKIQDQLSSPDACSNAYP
jgi:hypothetical protein